MTMIFFFSALACLGLATGAGKYPRFWLVLTGLGTLSALLGALHILLENEVWTWRAGFALGTEIPSIYLDGVAAIFLILISLIGGLSSLYAHQYWSEQLYPASARHGRTWSALLILTMILVVGLANGLLFLLAWEAFAISAYFLITLDKTRSETRRAGWLYLAASHVGTMILFAFFATLAAKTGSWELGPMRDNQALAPFFWLALAGFGVKAGLFPLHVWLPSAHANAPSHVSALMSAVAIKMGVYGIIRYSAWLPTPAGADWTLLGLGMASALFGIIFALVQNDIKRLLAYCSVENVGIILIGLGLSLVAQTHGQTAWGHVALCGTFLHIINHGLFKALLFLGAGSVLQATGTRDMNKLGGLWRSLPWTTGLFSLGAVAVSSLPPLNGFISEWMIYLGLIRAIATKSQLTFGLIPVILVMAATGALALAAFAKATTLVFLGAPRTRPATNAHECGWIMRSPMLVLAGIMFFIGLFPIYSTAPISQVAASWNNYPDPTVVFPLASLGQFQILITSVIIGVAAMILCKARRNGLLIGPTWDCGYAAPTSRMQYSSGSFASIVAGWFAWILRPARLVRRVRGHFPEHARILEQVPDTVLEKIVYPLGTACLWLADITKKMQHGRVHLYIFYILSGAIMLGAVTIWGGAK